LWTTDHPYCDNRQYDAKGNLRDWWDGDDGKKYEARANVMVKQVKGRTNTTVERALL
jgi:predicted metalloendopeptidase